MKLVFLNGQLLREGHDNDYVLNSDGIRFNVKLRNEDFIDIINVGWIRTVRNSYTVQREYVSKELFLL